MQCNYPALLPVSLSPCWHLKVKLLQSSMNIWPPITTHTLMHHPYHQLLCGYIHPTVSHSVYSISWEWTCHGDHDLQPLPFSLSSSPSNWQQSLVCHQRSIESWTCFRNKINGKASSVILIVYLSESKSLSPPLYLLYAWIWNSIKLRGVNSSSQWSFCEHIRSYISSDCSRLHPMWHYSVKLNTNLLLWTSQQSDHGLRAKGIWDWFWGERGCWWGWGWIRTEICDSSQQAVTHRSALGDS